MAIKWKYLYEKKCPNCKATFFSPYITTTFCSSICSSKINREKNKIQLCAKRKEYRNNHSELIKIQKHDSYIKNKEKHKEHDKIYRENNKERKQKYDLQYKKLNRIKQNKQVVDRRNNDINFKLLCNLRKRICKFVTGKSKHTIELLGCDIDYFKIHLENKFVDGMTWKNYGPRGWHVDHIIPCTYFNLNNIDEQKKCFHYTNLQPLWWRDNIIKGNKIINNGDEKDGL